MLRIKQLPIPLAPRAEQDRIVAAIEEHFSRLDAVESTLKRELRSIAALRWSLLTDAFKVDGTLPRNWQRKEIGEVAEVQLGRQRSPQHHAGPQMRPYLRAANVTWTGLKLDDVKQMNFDEDDFETYRLHPGDLLLNEASGSPNEVGKPAVWWGEIEDCCFQNTLLRLQARDVDPDYLYWYCYMAALTGRFGEAGRGVNIRHLGKRGLARFPIAVAPPSEQKDIVTRLQEQFQQSSECETSVRQAQERARALRCSILAKAFNGQLVPQDPDDGPADVLLRRLSREKSTRSKRERAAA
ncbi:restriction endonuclease subunit S [Candidatus Poriferisodalis sp.]|uniref:restriction endonuclease subunit S n=1 Tax=Candidatus Poriferisodalis sp. TaxID=3101277 RepID=UPI003D144923